VVRISGCRVGCVTHAGPKSSEMAPSADGSVTPSVRARCVAETSKWIQAVDDVLERCSPEKNSTEDLFTLQACKYTPDVCQYKHLLERDRQEIFPTATPEHDKIYSRIMCLRSIFALLESEGGLLDMFPKLMKRATLLSCYGAFRLRLIRATPSLNTSRMPSREHALFKLVGPTNIPGIMLEEFPNSKNHLDLEEEIWVV
jgi:hypothetical protein